MKPLHVAAIVATAPFAAVAMCWAAYWIVRGGAVVLLIAEAMLERV